MKFLWNVHESLIKDGIKPGSMEDKRFLALALCGEVGETCELIVRGKTFGLEEEIGDVYAYLCLLALAYKIRVPKSAPQPVRSTLLRAPEWGLFLSMYSGKIANMLKKQWRGDKVPNVTVKLQIYIEEVYNALCELSMIFGLRSPTEILDDIIVPKIKARWPEHTGEAA